MLKASTILVTGGTGSFGKQFVRMLLEDHAPKQVIIFSRDEGKQHDMRVAGLNDPALHYVIGDIRDRDRLRRVMHGVDVVVHAAALKQIPVCERNPTEAVKTNVTGALNVIDAAIDCGVKKALAISTDKAVNPVNLYGATKLCAEKAFVEGNAHAGPRGTRFSCTRYGNVVGSRGSVVPIFLQQRTSGTITVTDERMTRFWLTLEHGVRYVLGCLEAMQGGEIFVPKVPSMRLSDLARAIAPDCRVEHIGMRPGEKLHEVLLSADEARQAVEREEGYVIQPDHPWWQARNPRLGEPVPDGFAYTSDGNAQWWSVEQLRQLVEGG